MEKRLAVKMAGQENGPIFDLAVRPGTSPRQILEELRLPGYFLVDPVTKRMFPHDSDLYPAILDGQKAFAVSEMIAGLARG